MSNKGFPAGKKAASRISDLIKTYKNSRTQKSNSENYQTSDALRRNRAVKLSHFSSGQTVPMVDCSRPDTNTVKVVDMEWALEGVKKHQRVTSMPRGSDVT